MRRFVPFALLLLLPLQAQARGRAFGWCEVGNVQVTIAGTVGSSSRFQQSAPSCTVTVYDTGTANLSTIFSDNSGTSKANPFTAAANGYWFFYADNAGYDVVLSGGGLASPVTLADYSLLDPTTGPTASTAWSTLTAPSGNLSLSMSTNLTSMTWGNLSGTNNAWAMTDGATSTSTGSLLNLSTGSGSTMKPFTATAQGTANGVQMSLAGMLAAIGTGGITATAVSCTGCITDANVNATGITTRSKLPAALAYEDEANIFTTAQTFNTTIDIKGSTSFAITLTGAPTANRTVTIPNASDTLVNTASAQTLSSKTFSDNIVFQSGTAFNGTFDHAISAARTWTLPDAAGTLLIAPSLTSGSILTTDGSTITQDNSNLFWNSTTKRLGIGTASPAATLEVKPRAAASEITARFSGNSTANAEVIQIYDSAGSPVKQSYFDANAAFNTAKTITSTVTTGTAPFVIASTTVSTNLNADKLDGNDWAAPAALGSGTPAAVTGTTITANTSATSPLYKTTTNCADSAGDAACSAAPAGSVVVDATDTDTIVSTTAVTANSQIFLQIDASLGTRLSVTCNTQAASVFNPRVTARTAGTSFTITVDAGPTTNPLCISYFIVN